MKLESLVQVARLLGREPSGLAPGEDRWLHGFSTDSRHVGEGELFIALKGENFDGHEFVGAAAGKGAIGAIVADDWLAMNRELSAAMPLIGVEDPLVAYGEIAREHRRGFNYPVIAVAGSNGKTTTKELIAAVLAEHFNVHHTTGNLNNLIGVPATMLKLDGDHTAAVIEIGTNAPGEIERLCRILEPTHGIITNIGREHLELLGSIEGVAEEETALFRHLERSGGTAFVNMDDPHLARSRAALSRCVTYGTSEDADVHGTVKGMNHKFAPHVSISAAGRSIEIDLQLPGAHSATNAIAAAAVGMSLGVPCEGVKRALEAFEPLVGHAGYARLAPVKASNGATILNDTYNANPDSMMVAFRTMEAMKGDGRRILVLGDMRELGASSEEEHRRLGSEIAGLDGIDAVYFLGPEMLHAHNALRGERVKSVHFDEKRELIARVREEIQPSDIVLIKGSRGMKMEEVVAALSAADPSKH